MIIIPSGAQLVAKARLTSQQTFSTGDYRVVAWDTVDYDKYGGFTTGSSAKYTVQTGQAGDYLVVFGITTDPSNDTVNDEIWIGHTKNGTNESGSYLIEHIYATGSYSLTVISLPWVHRGLIATDYIDTRLRPIATQKLSHTNALFVNTVLIFKIG